MRVLHVQKVKGLGGSEQHLLALLPALAARGHDVRTLALVEGDWPRFTEPLAALGVDVRSVPAGADLSARAAMSIRGAIGAFTPDLVHTHLIHADVHGQTMAKLMRTPAVSTVHNMSPLLRRVPVREAARFAAHLARRTIAISEHVRAYIEGFNIPRPGSVRVVPYGIDLDTRRLDPTTRADVRRHYGMGDDDVIVTIAARLMEGKGHELLLDAMDAATAAAPRLTLLVTGDGPLRAQLEAQARSLPEGTVWFLGFIDDTRGMIGASDIVVFPTLPSLGEGFGLTALEAMAAGVPVIASDTGALPEVVADGRTGLIVPGGDIPTLAQALIRLANDPAERRRLGTAGIARARERFSLDVMIEATLAVYAEALAAG